MKKALLLLIMALACGLAYSYENTYAVIIGIADYEEFSKRDGDLRYTVNDATKFYEFLKSPKGGSVPEANICLLLDADASKDNIVKKSKELFSKAQNNDRVIFYYSGHGSQECFLPYDVTRRGKNMLFFDEVKKIFRCAKCHTKLLFADACFSGTMKESILKKTEKRNKRHKDDESDNMNIAVMMSCKADETSLEMGKLKQGVFTYYLIKGLGGEANKDGNRFITIQELFYYMYHKVQETAAEGNNKQTPELFGNFDLRLIVANVDANDASRMPKDEPVQTDNSMMYTAIIAMTATLIVTVVILLLMKKRRKQNN